MSVFLFEKEYCLLEPCEGKLSRTVLRGESTRKGADLPDCGFIVCCIAYSTFYLYFLSKYSLYHTDY